MSLLAALAFIVFTILMYARAGGKSWAAIAQWFKEGFQDIRGMITGCGPFLFAPVYALCGRTAKHYFGDDPAYHWGLLVWGIILVCGGIFTVVYLSVFYDLPLAFGDRRS